MPTRQTANPRRTTLAEVPADRFPDAGRPEDSGTELPASTANPRRTVLDTLPQWRPVAD